MTVGATVTAGDVNSTAAQIARMVFNTFRAVEQFQEWLATKTENDLIALGFTSGEVAILKSSFTDLDKVRQVFEGSATQASAYDARTFAKQLLGCGLY